VRGEPLPTTRPTSPTMPERIAGEAQYGSSQAADSAREESAAGRTTSTCSVDRSLLHFLSVSDICGRSHPATPRCKETTPSPRRSGGRVDLSALLSSGFAPPLRSPTQANWWPKGRRKASPFLKSNRGDEASPLTEKSGGCCWQP